MSDTMFTMAGFLNSADDALYAFTESSTQTAWDMALKRKIGNAIPDINIDTSYLDSMVKVASSLSLEAKVTAEFFGNESTEKYITKNPMTIQLKRNSLPIDATGLKNFVDKIKRIFDELSTGKISIKDANSFFNDPKTLIKYKRAIFDNDVDIYRNSKDILKGNPTHDIVLNKESISDIRSSLYKFSTVLASGYVGKKDELRNLNSLSFANGTIAIKYNIATYNRELKKYIDVASGSNIASTVWAQVGYSAKLYFAELCKYLIAIYLQFMSDAIHDVRTEINVKRQIDEVLTTTAVAKVQATMESVASYPDEFTLEDIGPISSAIDDLINDIRNCDWDKNTHEEDTQIQDMVDHRAYELPVKIMMTLSQNLKDGSDYYKDHHHSVSDELIIRRYELANTDIWKILTDPFYGNKFVKYLGHDHDGLIVDLRGLKKFLMTMKNLINSTNAILDDFIMITREMDGPDSVLVQLLSNIKVNLKDCYKGIAEKAIGRMDVISNVLFPTKNYTKIITDTNNYFIDAFDVNYDYNKLHHDEKVLTLNHKGQQEFIESAIAPRYSFEPYFEDDNANNNQNQQQNDQNQNTNNQNTQQNNQDQNKGASTTPKITDNSANDNQSNKSDQNNSGNNDQNSSQKLSERIKTFIDGVIQKIGSFFSKNNAKATNLKFINDHKQYLLNRSYANVTLENMTPYIPMNYADCMNKMIDRASKLTADQMKTMNDEQMYQYLYGTTSYAKVKGDSPDERFATAIKIGTATSPTVKYSNNDIKQMVPQMIEYLTNYYNKIENDLKSVSNNLDKLDVLSSYKGTGETDRTSANQSLVPKAINSGIGSCINVARQRANDYMKVLSSLVPESEKKKNSGNANTNNQNTDNQNSNNQNADNNNQQ